MDTNTTKPQTNETAPGGAEPGASQPEERNAAAEAENGADGQAGASQPAKPSSAAEAENGADGRAGGSLTAKPGPAASEGSKETAAAPDKNKFTPAQCALLSAFVYPGSGQLARGKKSRGWTTIALFSVFLIWWLIWLAMGALIVYHESSYVGIQYPEAIEEGMSYIKLSFIPGAAAAAIFVYSIYDAYKG